MFLKGSLFFGLFLYCNGQLLTPRVKFCEELYSKGVRDSGVYELLLRNGFKNVYCDLQTNNTGWTVVQQRLHGSEVFWNRTWNDYANGFGAVGERTEFYAGNELIHELTNRCNEMSILRIELFGDQKPGSDRGDMSFHQHFEFRIDSAAQLYTLHLKTLKDQGNASTGWYDISLGNMAPFSTIDRIHDPFRKCQTDYQFGGWWNKNCGMGTLNGAYKPKKWGDGYGLFYMIKGVYIINPKTTKMMIHSPCTVVTDGYK